ncbi:actin-85C-like [Phacochoerus africanus]|uniref:actin-85C-like n=1 Tax=Phacochoerus africanus TaxID=41426 RepID=UPI001FD8E594|nr:actin-85C-like [Phacochoerus africanus]
MPHNWDHAGKAWYHTYQEQRVAGGPAGNSTWVEDHRVMLAASPAQPQGSRKRMTQILFQTFNPLAIQVATQASLSLCDAPGHTSGVDMVSGGRSPTCCPAMRVTPCPPLLHQDLAIGDLTQHGSSFTTAAEQDSCLTPRSSGSLTRRATHQPPQMLLNGRSQDGPHLLHQLVQNMNSSLQTAHLMPAS